MQIIKHKNSSLTLCEKFFIEKSLEMLYLGTVDSYRARINNPKTILEELRYCLKEFDLGRIKHFHTIKASKDKKAIVDESINLITNTNYLKLKSISTTYLQLQLRELNEHNYKKLISTIEIILAENEDYLIKLLGEIEGLIKNCQNTFEELVALDLALNILYSELINKGYSKGFLYKLVWGIFVGSLEEDKKFKSQFYNFKKRFIDEDSEYEIIFRIDTSQKVYDAISDIANDGNLLLSDSVDDIKLKGKNNEEFNPFNTRAKARKFLRCKVIAYDYLAALKKGKSILSEYLDILNLGLSDESIIIHHRILVVDSRSPEKGKFQNSLNILDGKYRVEKAHYLSFAKKLPTILNNTGIVTETKEKIKSAIRYLRLGNQSVEMEHKFINYWIGLEYLFSNYESGNTINRLKDHFINAHTLAYTKRNLYHFKKSFGKISLEKKKLVPSYVEGSDEFLKNKQFYDEIYDNLLEDFPLLAYRAKKIKCWLFEDKKPANGKKYLTRHKENLEIHFTRIYRLRNEIIHDAATNTNNEQISSNLRYYLTFILNEIIDFLAKHNGDQISIEDYFILNEIRLGNIEQNGSLLEDLLEVDCAIDFIS